MARVSERLFTPHFFVMCGFSFTVFLSAFQLLPTAPYHILDLGGSTFASGMFLGFLTYASAFSAPVTGAVADRIGQKRVLIICSLALVGFSLAYAVITDYRVLLALVLVHGVFWSGLLSASASYMTHILPERRRAEGIGYWGLSTLAAISVAPDRWLLDLPPRLDLALRRHGCAQPPHGTHRDHAATEGVRTRVIPRKNRNLTPGFSSGGCW